MLRYYSFYLGRSGTSRKHWLLDDCKLIAPDAKSAVILHFFIKDYQMKIKSPWLTKIRKRSYLEPTAIAVQYHYRGVIEWEKVWRPKYGATLVNFKKARFISQHELIQEFT